MLAKSIFQKSLFMVGISKLKRTVIESAAAGRTVPTTKKATKANIFFFMRASYG
jgi:hypothetical protein